TDSRKKLRHLSICVIRGLLPWVERYPVTLRLRYQSSPSPILPPGHCWHGSAPLHRARVAAIRRATANSDREPDTTCSGSNRPPRIAEPCCFSCESPKSTSCGSAGPTARVRHLAGPDKHRQKLIEKPHGRARKSYGE